MHGKVIRRDNSSNYKRRTDSPTWQRKRPIRILIAAGQAIFRDALRALLQEADDFRVVGEASDGEAAISLVHRLKPEVLLLDFELPKTNAIEVLRQLSAKETPVRTLVFSSDIGSNETVLALNLGARGIVLKSSPGARLFEGIRRVMSEEYWISPDTIAGLVQRLRHPQPHFPSVPATSFGLTARELEVILEVVAGSSNPEIAKKLFLSEQTVKHHLTHVFDKLGVYNRVELAMFAVNHRLNEPVGDTL